jgi:hypothetical protein
MIIELTIEEKQSIIIQHAKNLEYSRYNIYLNLLEAKAKSSSDKKYITELEDDMRSIELQQEALKNELRSLEEDNG